MLHSSASSLYESRTEQDEVAIEQAFASCFGRNLFLTSMDRRYKVRRRMLEYDLMFSSQTIFRATNSSAVSMVEDGARPCRRSFFK
eukprot:scaffold2817_cov130-Cylindrotheca_fusiformis.AAC.7